VTTQQLIEKLQKMVGDQPELAGLPVFVDARGYGELERVGPQSECEPGFAIRLILLEGYAGSSSLDDREVDSV
jgi:hypothetical protein